MKILHYLFGCPPIRGGGLVKYALELAEAQNKNAEVCLLLPGPLARKREKRKTVSIKRKGTWKQIPQYIIYNPLPIPMGNGIIDIEAFVLSCDSNVYKDFLDEIKPDVIHVHTLMGIHREFFLEANKKKIPIIYTTHDYFGICPTTNLFMNGCVCEEPGTNCLTCSKYAFSNRRLCLEQSSLYKVYRHNNWLIRLLSMDCMQKIGGGFRSRHQHSGTENGKSANTEKSENKEYLRLLEYYRDIYKCITNYHFNSKIAKTIYEKHLGALNGSVVYISNKSVMDNRKIHKSGEILKIGFLGGDAEFKGLRRLQKVIEELYVEGKKQIELQIYGSSNKEELPFCKYFGAYVEEEREKVFGGMDILAVPSSWMETFAMVVWEAVSYGVPVVLTEKVGAKGLIEESTEPIGMVLADDDNAWKVCLADLYEHREKIYEYSRNICNMSIDFRYETHVKEMFKLYNESIGE